MRIPPARRDALAGAAYGSAGERCMAISVAVAVGDAGDRLVEALQKELAAIRVLPGTAEGADMGPLVTREHLDRVLGYVTTGVQEGAKLVVDGRKLDGRRSRTRLLHGTGAVRLGDARDAHLPRGDLRARARDRARPGSRCRARI